VTALRALLAGIVDYAGLFPPAALDMPDAVRNYAEYRASDDAWMLGRFVLPVARLEEFRLALEAVRSPRESEWRVAGLLGGDLVGDLDLVRTFNAAHAGLARVDVVEGKVDSVDTIERAAAAADVAATVDGTQQATGEGDGASHTLALFAELPVAADLAPLVLALQRGGASAKLRTGGVTPDAIPAAHDVVRFIRACVDARVSFKATAGLHHPLRAEYALTYESDAPRGVMFGFLNVFLAAAFLQFGMGDDEVTELLEERSASSLEIVDGTITWRDHTLSAAQIRVTRDVVACSFGSCSFREPVDDLRALAILS
jgi:hypothetical protein